MKRLGIVLLFAMAALLAATEGASAQSPDRAQVITVCGTLVNPYTAGDVREITQNINGQVCINATVSASVAVAPLTSTNSSSTIAVTNTFQSIQASTVGRKGCTIENQSTVDTMWVFFGPIGSATKATSFVLD